MQITVDKRSRWIEITFAVLASIAASAAVSFLTIPVTLEQFRNKLANMDQAITVTQLQLAAVQSHDMAQEVRIAVNSERISTNDQRWAQVTEQYRSLNEKFDRRWGR